MVLSVWMGLFLDTGKLNYVNNSDNYNDGLNTCYKNEKYTTVTFGPFYTLCEYYLCNYKLK